MDEHFYQSPKITKQRLKHFMHKKDQPAIVRFIIMYAMFLVMSLWVVLSWGGAWWNLALAQLGFGVVGCSTFAALHETAHGTAFKAKKLNELTAILAGLAHIYPAGIFRELHFTHHRHTHVPGLDPEISIGNRLMPSVIKNLPMYFGWLTGIPLFSFKIVMLLVGALGMPEPLRKNFYPFIRPKARKKIAIESLWVLGVYIGLLLLALYVHSGFWGLFTGQALGHCMLAGYLVMEHNGLPHEGSILDKTRSIKTNQLVKLLMWNMPYHAEHHAYPAVPFHALPALHEEMKDELKHKEEGHPGFHLKILGRLVLGKGRGVS